MGDLVVSCNVLTIVYIFLRVGIDVRAYVLYYGASQSNNVNTQADEQS